MAEIRTEKATLKVADGTEMAAWVARPVGQEAWPGIMVFQEAFGVNHHIRNVTERFAREGLVAIAPELYHRQAPGFEGAYDNFAPIQKLMQSMTEEGTSADVQAAYDWLQAQQDVRHDHIAAVGYCMGGRVTYLANSVLPLQAAVSYYGGGISKMPERAASLHAPHLFFWGGQDKHIPQADINATVDALKAAKKPFVNVEFSTADHGFFCDERPSYDPTAARESWALTLAFLQARVMTA
ncbi:MAG: dienelactone hydrolase family protein [Candidatus Xenobia bacterium]